MNDSILFQLFGYNYGEQLAIIYDKMTTEKVQEIISDAVTLDDEGNLKVNGTTIGNVEQGSQITSVTLDENDNLVIAYKLETGEEKTITTSLTALVDVYEGGEGIEVEGKTISIKDSEVATQTELDTVAGQVTTLANTAITSVELTEKDDNSYELLVNKTSAGGFTIPDVSDFATTTSVEEDIKNLETTISETYQPKGEYVTSVELTTTDDSAYELLVDNKSVGGFTIPDVSGFATIESLETLQTTIDALQTTVEELQIKVDELSKTNIVTLDLTDLTGDITDETADYVVSGNLTSTVSITGKSITLDNSVVISNDNRLNLKAKDVTIDGSTISGEYVKANGNSVVKIDECETVTIKNMTFDDTYTGYNGIEIALAQDSKVYPKTILIDNCTFNGTFSNNAINIFATQDDATITISNCYFDNVSQGLRISNTQNAKNVVFNIANCTVNEWEHSEGSEYCGFALGQDYTSSAEEVVTNNLFGPSKITFNFTNLVHKNEKVLPTTLASVCGSGDENQVLYMYANEEGLIPYTEETIDRWPTISFN